MVRGAARIPVSIGSAQPLAQPVFRAWPRAKRRFLFVKGVKRKTTHVEQGRATRPCFFHRQLALLIERLVADRDATVGENLDYAH